MKIRVMKIKLKIQDYNNRTNMVMALADAGYKVWVEKEEDLASVTYYVCFEYPEQKTPSYSFDSIPCSSGTSGVEEYCSWADVGEGSWETDCGNMLMLIDGTPKQNKMEYCLYCGKKLDEKFEDK